MPEMFIEGASVEDAKRAVRITISETDIRHASRKLPEDCAAALACKRELHADDVRIHIGRVYLKMNGKWVRFRPSPALRTEIVAFDRGGQFAPGEYLLKAMPPKKSHHNHKTAPKPKSIIEHSHSPAATARRGRPARRVHIVVNSRRRYHRVGGIRPTGNNYR